MMNGVSQPSAPPSALARYGRYRTIVGSPASGAGSPTSGWRDGRAVAVGLAAAVATGVGDGLIVRCASTGAQLPRMASANDSFASGPARRTCDRWDRRPDN